MFSISPREDMGNEPAVLHPLTFVIYGRWQSPLHRRRVVERECRVLQPSHQSQLT
jgi:hypothetical protein